MKQNIYFICISAFIINYIQVTYKLRLAAYHILFCKKKVTFFSALRYRPALWLFFSFCTGRLNRLNLDLESLK